MSLAKLPLESWSNSRIRYHDVTPQTPAQAILPADDRQTSPSFGHSSHMNLMASNASCPGREVEHPHSRAFVSTLRARFSSTSSDVSSSLLSPPTISVAPKCLTLCEAMQQKLPRELCDRIYMLPTSKSATLSRPHGTNPCNPVSTKLIIWNSALSRT
jgi:hypothetical protein